MPTNQVQASNPPTSNELHNVNKPPPLPSKLPPPPPPPPKNTRPPPPPPPPPPRNTSQLITQSASIINQSLTSIVPPNSMLIHNGSSMSSLNSIGRCSHVTPANGHYSSSNHGQRNFVRHGECGSRSSMSSHGSQSHHHHKTHINNGVNTATGLGNLGNVPCSYQQNPPCSWVSTATTDSQHNHIAIDNKGDNGLCNTNIHHQDGRCQSHLPCTNCCQHNGHANKCRTQNFSQEDRINGQHSLPVISRNTIITNQGIGSETQIANSCCNNGRNHLTAELMPPHHHHYHHHHHNSVHGMQMSSSSTLSSVQPMESDIATSAVHHRSDCTMSSNNLAQQAHEVELRHGNQHLSCDHQHLMGSDCGHHQTGCLGHSHQSVANTPHHLAIHHGCATCPCFKKEAVHFECNTNNQIVNDCNSAHPHHHQHFHSETVPKCHDIGRNEPMLTNTTHVHNLSNSSTTTHSSNVAVKQQLQYHHHGSALSRGTRSSSSQHYEQYGLSSAASTSSATASLSSYPLSMTYDDMSPLFQSRRSNQPVPPPPPPHLSETKSHPASPSHRMFMTHNNLPISQINFNYNQQTQLQSPPPPPPPPLSAMAPQLMSNQLPPLPPKPISPNASSCSTQITTVRTSPSLQNQPITRVTSQAGVQNPLPKSDIPPPLPPLNPGLRSQLQSNQVQTKNHAAITGEGAANQPHPLNYNINLSYNRGGIFTDAERKTEALARQVELELDEQQRSGHPLGTCPKCNSKVMPSQEACKAMNQIYHAQCFTCCECGRTMLGKTFYPVGDRVYCEEDFKYTGHMQQLEKCAACFQPIFNMILPAMGKSYHPKCFKCCICGKSLDGVPFTVDRRDKIYCVEDYHNIYSPKCAACGKTISPIDGTGETVRVVSMDKDYHIDCYCCEDCGLQLTDEEPSRSYPLDGHLFCQQCHINRLSRKLPAALSLS